MPTREDKIQWLQEYIKTHQDDREAVAKLHELQTYQPPAGAPETRHDVNEKLRDASAHLANGEMPSARMAAGAVARYGLPIAAGLATGGAGFIPATLIAGAAGMAGGEIDDKINNRPHTMEDAGWDALGNMAPLAGLKALGLGFGALRGGVGVAGKAIGRMNPGATRDFLTRASARLGGITPAEKMVELGKTGALRNAVDSDVSEIGANAKRGGGFAPATQTQVERLGARAGVADEMAPLAKQDPLAGLGDNKRIELYNLAQGGESAPEAAAALSEKYGATSTAGRRAQGLRGGVPPTPEGAQPTPEGIAEARAYAKSIQAHSAEADLAARADKNLPELQRQGAIAEGKSFEASKNLKQAVDDAVPQSRQRPGTRWLEKEGRWSSSEDIPGRSPQDVFTDVKSNYPTADNKILRGKASAAQEEFRTEGVNQDAQRQALVDKARATGLFGKVPSAEDVAADAARAEQISGWAPAAHAANKAEGAAAAMGASADPAADAMASHILGRASKTGDEFRTLAARGDALGGVDLAGAGDYRTRATGLQNWLAAGSGPTPTPIDIAHPLTSTAKRVGQALTPQPNMNLLGEAELAYRGMPAADNGLRATVTTPRTPTVLGALGAGGLSVTDKYQAIRDWLSQAQNQ